VSQYVGKLDTDVEQKLAEMDKHVSKCMDAQAVQEALSTDKSEENEIERRKTNVIVHGVPESDADDVDRRTDDDMTVLAAMFHEVEADDIKVGSVVRLGKKAADPIQNRRPIKVVLDSVDNKVTLLRKAKKTERKGGRRLVQDLHPPGPDTQATRSQKAPGCRTKAEESQRGNRSNNLSRRGCKEKRALVDFNELLCVYLNARSLINKFHEFEAWITAIDPDIVGVTETWANSSIFDSELMIKGYDVFRKDRPVDREGGGVLLYAKSNLHAVEFVPDSNFPEQIWCQIQSHKQDKFYIGVCYRTPSPSIFQINIHSALRELISKTATSGKHFMLMGDFNYAFSRWPPLPDIDGLDCHAKEFCSCLDDNFLYQHVVFPTRKDNILDLIVTDEPDMITDIRDLGALAM